MGRLLVTVEEDVLLEGDSLMPYERWGRDSVKGDREVGEESSKWG